MKKVGLVRIPDALVHLQTRGVGGTLRAQGEKGSCWMNLKCIYGFHFMEYRPLPAKMSSIIPL